MQYEDFFDPPDSPNTETKSSRKRENPAKTSQRYFVFKLLCYRKFTKSVHVLYK